MKFKISLLLIILVHYLSFGQDPDSIKDKSEIKSAKNIVLLIGDGMGLSQVTASVIYNEGKSNFERFPVVGLIKTNASSDPVTDSAAAATAFASGVKTYNGAIGVDKDSKLVPTIVEQVSAKGMTTGIIATSSLTHATPACFYAHVQDRGQAYDIAAFLPKSDIDFFAGGGRKYFDKRKDRINLLDELETNGFVVSLDELPVKGSDGKLAILLADNEMPKMQEGRGNFLADATQLALDNLSKNKKGFFLMIEASQIDWGGHDNDTNYLIQEQLDFDKTIGLVLDFAAKNAETLVIVTADHETGGFTLATDNGNYNKIKPSFSTGGHSATMVPVFAMGPGADLFSGIYDNTEIYHKMLQALAHYKF